MPVGVDSVCQVMPSADVRIVPPSPTTTNTPAPNAAPFSATSTLDFAETYFLPSVDLKMRPPFPTVTNVPLAKVTSSSVRSVSLLLLLLPPHEATDIASASASHRAPPPPAHADTPSVP